MKHFGFFILMLCVPALMAAQTKKVLIYNNLAYVTETHTFELDKGSQNIAVKGIPLDIVRSSLNISGSTANIEKVNFRYSNDTLFDRLKQHIGESIVLTVYQGEKYKGVLESVDPNFIRLNDFNTLHTFALSSVVHYSSENREKKVDYFSIDVSARRAGSETFEISYILPSLMWIGEYNIQFNPDQHEIEMATWAKITNNSTSSVISRDVTLIAGKVTGRVAAASPRLMFSESKAMMADYSEPQEENVPQSFHAYTANASINLAFGDETRIRLIDTKRIDVKQTFVYDSNFSADRKIVSTISFENIADTGAGVPLPAGIVYLYEQPSDVYLGTDNLKNSAVMEKVKLSAGVVFDLNVDKTNLGMKRFSDRTEEHQFQLTVRNVSGVQKSVILRDHFHGDWTIVESSHKFQITNVDSFEFNVQVSNEQTVIVEYTIKRKY